MKKRTRRLGLILLGGVFGALAARVGYDVLGPPAERWRAERALERGDETAVARIALGRLRRSPRDAWAARLGALALLRAGQFASVSELLETAEQGGRARPGDWLEFGSALLRQGRRGEAEAAWRQGLVYHPEDVGLLKSLGALMVLERRNEEALDAGRRLIELPGGLSFGLGLISMVEYERGRPGPASQAAVRLLEWDPDLVDTPVSPEVFWSDLASSLIELGDAGRAVDLLRREIRRRRGRGGDPLQAGLYEALGRASLSAGDPASARSAYMEAVRLDRSRVRSLIALGQLALQMGDASGAVVWLERAAAVDPLLPEVWYSLSRAYRALGRTEEADRLLERHRELSRGLPQTRGMGAAPGRG